MSAKKLAVYEKEAIIKILKKPYVAEVEKLSLELANFIVSENKKSRPTCLNELLSEPTWSKMVQKDRYFYPRGGIDTLLLPEPIFAIFPEKEEDKVSTTFCRYIPTQDKLVACIFSSLEAKVVAAIKKQKEVEGKLRCVLEHISSAPALQKEFPEAYAAYLENKGIPTDSTGTLCDSIEDVRAMINSKK